MGLNKDLSWLLVSCKDVAKFGELYVIRLLADEFPNRQIEWFGGRKPFDILFDGKKIEVKSCNKDNQWAKSENIIGFDQIDPNKFDFLICVSFNGNFKDIRYYVFSRDECLTFPKAIWGKNKNDDLRKLEIPNQSTTIQELVDNSLDSLSKFVK